MGRIKKAAAIKHDATLSPAIRTFVRLATDVRLCDLPAGLESFPSQWPFARGDLYHWIPLLNRFDEVLERFNLAYGLKSGPQTEPFSRRLLLERGESSQQDQKPKVDDAELNKLGFGVEGDRELVESILTFSRLLLGNCASRSLYSSSPHLNDLLNTTSLSLLVHTLRLSLQLAQRYHASRQRNVASAQTINPGLLASHYAIDLDRVHKLASPFTRLIPSSSRIPSSAPTTPSAKGKEKAQPVGRSGLVSQQSEKSIKDSVSSTPSLETDLVGIAKGIGSPATTIASPERNSGEEEAAPSASADAKWDARGSIWFTYYATGSSDAGPSQHATSSAPGAAQLSANGVSPVALRRTSSLGQQSSRRRSNLSASEDASIVAESPFLTKSEKTEEDRGDGVKGILIPLSKMHMSKLPELIGSLMPEVPKESQYDLLHRLRVASALSTSLTTRHEILAVRLLAITNLAYVYPEQMFQQKLLQQDSDEPRRLQLAYQLAELVHPPQDRADRVPRWLQTLALGGLEGLAKHKSKAADVCAALSVNVNHGVLLYVIRKAVSEMESDAEDRDELEKWEWNEALFSLLAYLPSTPRTGEALVSAGLLPILLDVLKLRTSKAERNHPKVLNFLDTFVYNVRDAFQTLANAKGLDYISDLTAFEVESGLERARSGQGMPQEYRTHHTDFSLPYFQQQTLRWLFKFMNHMMAHGGGNFDRLLRNLIDSPQLLGGLRTVLSNAEVFGSNVWSGAVNIMSHFIHNEPTSYAVVAEAGLSIALLESVTGSKIALPQDDEQGDVTMDSVGDLSQTEATGGAVSVQPQQEVDVLARARAILRNEGVGASGVASSGGLFGALHEGVPSAADAQPTTSSKSPKRDTEVIEEVLISVPEGPLAQGILPAIDSIATIPQAFGAICLNASGLKLFQSTPALERFFEIFISPEHVKCMSTETELPGMLGSSFDELVRHHPPLRRAVMTTVLKMVVTVAQLCRSRAHRKGVGAKLWFEDANGRIGVAGGRQALLGKVINPLGSVETAQEAAKAAKQSTAEDVQMSGADEHNDPELSKPDPDQPSWIEEVVESEDEKQAPSVAMYLDVVAKFLSGFFSNVSLCGTFIEMGGAEWILDFTMLPSLQYDFHDQSASHNIARVVHTLVEQKPHLVLPSVLKRVQAAIDDLGPLYNHSGRKAYFGPLVTPNGTAGINVSPKGKETVSDVKSHGTELVKSLVTLHALSNILCETFGRPIFSHRSGQNIFSQVNLTDVYSKLVTGLAAVNRACIWEEIQLQKTMPSTWMDATRIKGFGAGSDEADAVLGLGPSLATRSQEMAEQRPDGSLVGDRAEMGTESGRENDSRPQIENHGSASKSSVTADAKTAQFKNVQVLRYLLSYIPMVITPFFQGLGKLLVSKRQPDNLQKQNALTVADAIAEAIVSQLDDPPANDGSLTSDKYAYWIVTLTSLTQLMIDSHAERPQPQSVTIVLQAFKNKGGFTALRRILQIFFGEIKAHGTIGDEALKDDNTAALLTSASGGIKIILTFFLHIVTSRTIVEATQSTSMISRDRDRERPDFFSPNQFVVELRMAVLPIVQTMWDSEFIDKASSSIAKSLIEVLRLIFDGEHENGAYKRADNISLRAKAPPKSWRENTERREKLVTSGYDETLAREALFRCYDNPMVAEDYCRFQTRLNRLTRNPLPEGLLVAQSSTPYTPTSTTNHQSAAAATENVTGGQASMAPPMAADGQSVIVDAPSMDIEEGTSRPAEGLVAPPIAPVIPVDGLLPGNEGLVGISLENLVGGLSDIRSSTPQAVDAALDDGDRSTNDQIALPSDGKPLEAGTLPVLVTVDDLDELRATLRQNLIDRSLDILNVHDDVTFELADLIMSAVSGASNPDTMRAEIGEILFQSLVSLQVDDDAKPTGKRIAAYAHLLALILQDKDFYDATVGEIKANFALLISFIKLAPDQSSEGSAPWVGRVLLIIERLLADDAQPRQLKWTPPTSDVADAPSPVVVLEDPVISHDQRIELFESMLEVLPRVGKDESFALSVARILVILTRNRDLAILFGERRNLQRLFLMVKQLGNSTSDKFQSAVLLVLRHVIEDEATLRQFMKTEIKTYFESRQTVRQVDTHSYVRQMHHLVLRQAELFVQVSNEMVELTRFDASARNQSLTLKASTVKDDENSAASQEHSSTQKDPDVDKVSSADATGDSKAAVSEATLERADRPKSTSTEHKAPVVEHPDGVIHFLLSELLSYKDVEDKDVASVPAATQTDPQGSSGADVDMANDGTHSVGTLARESTSDAAAVETKPEKSTYKPEQHPIFIYRCFILQCLTELLSCYVRTKIEFINYSRKAQPRVMTPSKPRSSVLNYLLNDLIPVGTLNHAEDIRFRKKFSTSNWAISAVVALCAKTGERGYQRHDQYASAEDETDLLFVRKFVLEHALKVYKDASTHNEPLDSKYARMMNLADMFNRMLTGKPNSGGSNTYNDMLFASHKQLARIMFEKNFISAFTTSIADIDLNFPTAKRAIKYILRPLKLLTQTAIDLSESSSIVTSPGQTDMDEISSATSVSEAEEDREETPDLFRNSTLGMFEPGREETWSSESSNEDDEMYDEEYDDEMEYEEDMAGEEDDEDALSDEDDNLRAMEGLAGDVGVDVEVVLNGDENDDDSDSDDDDDSEDMDDGEDIEIVDEINADDDNDSDPGHGEGEWQSADDEDYAGAHVDDADEDEDEDVRHEQHDNPLEHIVRALEGDNATEILQEMEGDLNMDIDPEGYMEDDMQDDEEISDEDDEDDEDDMDEAEAIYEGGFEEDVEGVPNVPWGWEGDADGTGIERHHHSDLRRPHQRVGQNPWSLLPPGRHAPNIAPTFRSHRPTGGIGRGTDDGSNPLLQRGNNIGNNAGQGRSARHEAMSDWVHAMDPSLGRGQIHGESHASLITNLIHAMSHGGAPFGGLGGLGSMQHHGGALHFRIAGGNPSSMSREVQAMLGMRRPQTEVLPTPRNDPSQSVTFVPTITAIRWQEEARLLFGQDVSDKTHRVLNALLSVLVPPALERERSRRAKAIEEAERQKKEDEKRAENERISQQTAEKEAKEKREADEQEAARLATADLATADVATEVESSEVGSRDVEENAPENEVEGDDAAAHGSGETTMEGIETPGADTAGGVAAAGPSETPAPRVRTTIRGRELDITGMDIDPEYLDALPEELREEVLMHQIAEQRSRAVSSGEQPSDISREFLEALPEEIRDELLEQEASDRRRREREETRRREAASGGAGAGAGGGAGGGPSGATAPVIAGEDMDPASVLATLEPGLRQAILMEQDDDVLAQLPQALAAEARALGGEHRLRHHFVDAGRLNRSRAIAQDELRGDDSTEKPPKRVIVQMLDKSGVATLLRLMFMPQQGSARQTFNGILRNVCENRQNRAEVVNLLLSILQDGSADVSAVERSFAHLSLRARQPTSVKAPSLPQLNKKSSVDPLPRTNTDMSPLMVVQQCLSVLALLVSHNPHIPSFFLTEHENTSGLKKGATRKGKGKDGKDSKASKFALNLLLGLLDRKLIMESSSVMEQLSHLLNSVTQPLVILLNKGKDAGAAEQSQITSSNGPVDADAEVTAPEGEAAATAPIVDADTDTQMELTDAARDGASTQGQQAEAAAPETTPERPSSAAQVEGKASNEDGKAKKQRQLVPPVVPEHNLRLVVHILSARECSAKTFRDTLSTINNLSAIPEAKNIFGEELIQQAQDLGHSIHEDLSALLPQIRNARSGADIQGMAIAKFSPASSDQSKLLRVLTALDYLFDPKKNDRGMNEGEAADAEGSKKKRDLLISLYENSTFVPVWSKLSDCLSAIRQREDMLNVATILLPLIEALMVVCKNTTLKTAPINVATSKEMMLSSPPPEDRTGNLENLFFRFTEEHRKILNDLVSHSPKLMSGTFSLLVKNPKVLEFDNKRNYFTRSLHSRGAEVRHSQPPLQLSVRRDQVFLDSFKSLYFKSGEEMKYGKLSIRFHGEEGVDAGGVTREWFQVLSRQMFNPDYALFTPVAADRTTFHPNRLSGINQEHFMFFKFIGRVIGKALYEGRVLDCHFSRAVYKRILGKPVSVKDMETLDLDYYKSLVWMLENDTTDIITETFAVESEAFGETQVIDLKENGRNIPVTEENKHEYARLVVEYRLTGSVQEQLDHFLRGFHDIVPAELISIFNEQELELLISGLPDIDVDDWKNNTELHNYSASSTQIQWFWRAVRSFDKEERAKLLQFVTGTSKVPLNGFKELEGMNGFSRFNIHRDYGNKDRLPSSHTCFNQLDLPEYESYETLRQQVYTAMTAGSEYFGFA